jgi:hypothetical protein
LQPLAQRSPFFGFDEAAPYPKVLYPWKFRNRTQETVGARETISALRNR